MGVLRGTARPSRQAELGRAGPRRAESSLAEPGRLGTGAGADSAAWTVLRT